jgi:hypothetical protein
MSDDRPDEGTAHQETVPPAAEPPTRKRWTDRPWGFKAIIAVALASVIIGGLGGAALANLGGRDGDDRTGPGFGHQFRGGPGQGRGPNGFVPPGQQKLQERRGDRGEQQGRDNS